GGIVSERYDGGLPWPLRAATWFMERQPFDLRVVFDYYFPDGLPDPAGVPASFKMSREINERVASCSRRSRTKPKFSGAGPASARIRNLTGTDVFFTYILIDLEQHAGGNPFDNRNIIYSGTPDDNALNDGVKRYASE